MKRIAEFLIKTNLVVSTAVASMVLQTQILFDCYDLNVVFFSFFSTLLIYNFQRIYKNRSRNKNTELAVWMERNKLAIFLFSGLALFGTLYTSFNLNFKSISLLALPFLISIIYVVRIIRHKKKTYALREIPGLKIFLIAFIWAIIIVFLPILNFYDNYEVLDRTTGIYHLEKFLFIIAITIPFDIRDLKYDPPELKTLAQLLGISKSVILSIILLLIALTLTWFLLNLGLYNDKVTIWMTASYLIFAILIFQSRKEKGELFYGGVLESVFIVQTIGVVILST